MIKQLRLYMVISVTKLQGLPKYPNTSWKVQMPNA